MQLYIADLIAYLDDLLDDQIEQQILIINAPREIADMVYPKGLVVELSLLSTEKKEPNERENLIHIRKVVDDLHHLPEWNGNFKLIIVGFPFTQIKMKEYVLNQEIAKLLSPGGRLVILEEKHLLEETTWSYPISHSQVQTEFNFLEETIKSLSFLTLEKDWEF